MFHVVTVVSLMFSISFLTFSNRILFLRSLFLFLSSLRLSVLFGVFAKSAACLHHEHFPHSNSSCHSPVLRKSVQSRWHHHPPIVHHTLCSDSSFMSFSHIRHFAGFFFRFGPGFFSISPACINSSQVCVGLIFMGLPFSLVVKVGSSGRTLLTLGGVPLRLIFLGRPFSLVSKVGSLGRTLGSLGGVLFRLSLWGRPFSLVAKVGSLGRTLGSLGGVPVRPSHKVLLRSDASLPIPVGVKCTPSSS